MTIGEAPEPETGRQICDRQTYESATARDTHGRRCVQLLTPSGERIEHPDHPADLTDRQVRDCYRDMVVVRALDAQATALQRQGELGLWASLLGQEAAQIGAGRALRSHDMVFPTYREHGVLYCRGIDPALPLGLFRGVTNGGWDPIAYRFGMYTVVIGAQTLHATGYAMGIAADRGGLASGRGTVDDEAVLAFLGDGATAQGDVNEAFVWASVFNAPVVFFCQNNQFAISQPPGRQSSIPLYRRADGFGFPGVRVDGNDVLAVHAVTRWALDRARRGDGPALIEAYTYRMGAHTTSDDPSRYRGEDEVLAWRAKDPIARVLAYLRAAGLADEQFLVEVRQEAAERSARLREQVLAMADPPGESIFDNVYPGGSPDLESQRSGYLRYQAAGATTGPVVEAPGRTGAAGKAGVEAGAGA